MDVERPGDPTSVERSLTDLRGVRSARVEMDAGRVRGVRVLVVPERTVEETVAEVREALASSHGLYLAPEAVEVLRSGHAGRPGRRRLSSVATERAGDRFSARVTLELAGDVLVGERNVGTGERAERRSLAEATLEGVGKLVEGPLSVHAVRLLNDAGQRVAVVVLGHGFDSYVGAAVVRIDDYDAIARATLDAVNRLVDAPRAGAGRPA